MKIPAVESKQDHSIEAIQDTAIRAAKAAGEIQRAHYGKALKIQEQCRHDLKLEVDRLCEQAILSTITSRFPDHAFITEERGAADNPSDYLWIIDPLDGTVNFCHSIPYFGTSVACHVMGQGEKTGLASLGMPLVGVVYAPMMDELFVGKAGAGATCNGETIRTGGETLLEEALVSMSFGSSEATMKRMEKLGATLTRKARKVRILGSTGLDMVNVACGRISGLIQGAVCNWDFAAARVVLEQSGGVFEARETGTNQWEILACAPGLYSALSHLVWK